MRYLQTVAVALVALLFAVTGASSAEVPSQNGIGYGATMVASSNLALPVVNPANAKKAIKVAQRRRSRRSRRRRSRRRGAVAGAIALGVLGAIVASEAARADDRAYRRHVRYCRRMARKCDRGYIWACDRFDDRC